MTVREHTGSAGCEGWARAWWRGDSSKDSFSRFDHGSLSLLDNNATQTPNINECRIYLFGYAKVYNRVHYLLEESFKNT